LGFEDWVFEIEESTGADISDTLMSVFNDPGSGEQMIDVSFRKIHSIYSESCELIADLMSNH
jgi:hypothetical protein